MKGTDFNRMKTYRIKSFFGNSVNAVKSQIWIAISVYVLVAIIKNDSGSIWNSTQFYKS